MLRRVTLVMLTLALLAAVTAQAQVVVVTDPATTIRNAITAVIKELVLNVERDQSRQLRRMSRRLSMYTNLDKYALPDPPRWRTHDFENPDTTKFARDYLAALNYGDASGIAFLTASHPVSSAATAMAQLTLPAQREVAARLATLDVADATALSSTDDSGRVRYNGRKEMAAIDALEAAVIDPSGEQSATAVLDKMSGAELIAARQRQARIELLAGIVEQLLVDSKRSRDADVQAMNMQLVTWRDAQAANNAFVVGTGDALRTWRQP